MSGWNIRGFFSKNKNGRVSEVVVPFIDAPVHEVLVPESDVHIFAISHPEHLSLIETPLASEDHIANGHHSHPEIKSSHVTEQEITHGSDASDHSVEKRERDPEEPVLKRAHEASTIQLFFDLYFVANLTTFSGQHEIHNWDGMLGPPSA